MVPWMRDTFMWVLLLLGPSRASPKSPILGSSLGSNRMLADFMSPWMSGFEPIVWRNCRPLLDFSIFKLVLFKGAKCLFLFVMCDGFLMNFFLRFSDNLSKETFKTCKK